MNGDDKHQAILNKASQDKFRLILDVPPILRDRNVNTERVNKLVNLDSIQFSHIGVEIPPNIIAPVSAPIYGQTPHVTSQVRGEYPPIKIAFTIDNMFNNYHMLYKWQEIINNPIHSGMDEHFTVLKFNAKDTTAFSQGNKNTPSKIEYKNIKHKHNFTDYQTTITLYALNEYDQAVAKFIYTNAFITTLGGISYNFQQTDQIECFFEFSFGQITMELIHAIEHTED